VAGTLRVRAGEPSRVSGRVTLAVAGRLTRLLTELGSPKTSQPLRVPWLRLLHRECADPFVRVQAPEYNHIICLAMLERRLFQRGLHMTNAKPRGRSTSGLTIAVLLAVYVPVVRADDAPAEPLDKMNQAFRAAYKKAREATLAKAGPVIMVDGDTLILKHGKERVEAAAVPVLYHRLKAVSHAPFGVYLLLGPGGSERLAEVRSFRDNVAAARDALPKAGFPEEMLPRQQKLLSECLDFLDGVLKRERCTDEELVAFTRKLKPIIEANVADAARVQIDAYQTQASAWQKKLGDDWSKVHVVVMGSAMPRKQNLAVQYFAWLLGEKGEGKRIVYAESLWDEARALNLLGTHLLDRQAATAFFDEPERLHRDLLADAAAEYLKKLKSSR
jgi:hypothetical protein